MRIRVNLTFLLDWSMIGDGKARQLVECFPDSSQPWSNEERMFSQHLSVKQTFFYLDFVLTMTSYSLISFRCFSTKKKVVDIRRWRWIRLFSVISVIFGLFQIFRLVSFRLKSWECIQWCGWAGKPSEETRKEKKRKEKPEITGNFP
jgi:hypothetical protein